ncbi:hypothetical protein BH24BAC1_BH24BAC1_02960 [soil metagenome]
MKTTFLFLPGFLLFLLGLTPTWVYSQAIGSDFAGFRSIRGYAGPIYSHITPLKQDYLVNLLAPYQLPARQLNPATNHGLYLSYYRNRLFTSLIVAFNLRDTEELRGFRSSLSQSVYGGSVGVNVLRIGSFVLSPYAGLRYNRYRNILSRQPRQLSLPDYLEAREVDLRLVQWSGAVGGNFSFQYKNLFSFGLYAEYLQPLHAQPLLYSSGNKLLHSQSAFLNRYSFGIGLGYGGSSNH